MSWAELFFPKNVKGEDVGKLTDVRNAFAECAAKLEHSLPEGRYKAMVKTKLEEAAMLSTKAFTHP